MKPNLSYYGQEVYAQDRDRFLLSLFVPAPHRESLLVLYALNVELAKVSHLVSEEMIGHIRYAWWRESVEGLYEGKLPQGQPVLEALYPLIQKGLLPQAQLMPLLESYCDHFPGAPPCLDKAIEDVAMTLLQSTCPEAIDGWRKAHDIIKRHRLLYGRRRNLWLTFRLLLAGL